MYESGSVLLIRITNEALQINVDKVNAMKDVYNLIIISSDLKKKVFTGVWWFENHAKNLSNDVHLVRQVS